MDATWHARPRGSATRTRAAPTWRVYIILFYYYYIYIKRVLQPRLDGEGVNPLKWRVLYTRHFPKYFWCGTNLHTLLTFQVTWREEKRRIDGARRSHASIAWAPDHDRSNQHVLDWASYNGPDVGDVARRGATDQTGDRSTRVDRVHRGPLMNQ